MRVRLLTRAAHNTEIAVAEIQLERHRVRGVRFYRSRHFFPWLQGEAPRRAPRHRRDGGALNQRLFVIAVVAQPMIRSVPILEAAVQFRVAEGRVARGEQLAARRFDRTRLRDLARVRIRDVAERPRVAVLEAPSVKNYKFVSPPGAGPTPRRSAAASTAASARRAAPTTQPRAGARCHRAARVAPSPSSRELNG